MLHLFCLITFKKIATVWQPKKRSNVIHEHSVLRHRTNYTITPSRCMYTCTYSVDMIGVMVEHTNQWSRERARTHAYIHTGGVTHAHTHVHTHTHARTYAYTHWWSHTRTYQWSHTHAHTYARAHTHRWSHTHTCTHTHARACTYRWSLGRASLLNDTLPNLPSSDFIALIISTTKTGNYNNRTIIIEHHQYGV